MTTILGHDPTRFRAARAAQPAAAARIYAALGRLAKGADDAHAAPVLTALQRAAELRSSLPLYEAELRRSGNLTEQGITAAMRAKRAEVRSQVEQLQAEVKTLRTKLPAAKAAPERKLPDGDAANDARLVAWFNGLKATERMRALSRAMAGEDNELCAALLRSERYIQQPIVQPVWERMREYALGPAPDVPPAEAELAARHEIAAVAEQELQALTNTFPAE